MAGLKRSATLAIPGAALLSNSTHLPLIEVKRLVKPVVFPSGRAMYSGRNGVATNPYEDNRNDLSLLLRRSRGCQSAGDDDLRRQAYQFGRRGTNSIVIAGASTEVD